MRYTRIYTGTGNQSHFEEREFEMFDALVGKITSKIPANCLYFGEISDTDEISWHNPPVPQLTSLLSLGLLFLLF